MSGWDRLADVPFAAACGLLRALGPVRASNLGGAVTRTLGPLLPVSRVARDNLARALPELDEAARARIARQVWDNLGRSVAEMPCLAQLGPTEAGPGWELIRHPEAAAADLSRGAIYVAGHLANWELMMAVARTLYDDFGIFYRAPANRAADRLAQQLRASYGGAWLGQFPKGAMGARQALAHLRGGHILGLLADQKLNDGIAVPFFGRPAMTAPSLAALALRFRVPVIPARAERIGPARFRVTFERPLDLPNSGDRHADIFALTLAVNQTLERWIRAKPGEWLWLHRRWPKEDRPGALPLDPAGV